MEVKQRRAAVNRCRPSLSIVHQCKLLDISRSGLYYQPARVSESDLELMKLIDCQYMVTPFYGTRKMAVWLKSKRHSVNRKHVRRLMQLMGLKAIYRHPRTSPPGPGNKIYPYLLNGMKITSPNQVWCADITYNTDGTRLHVSGGHHGLVQPVRTGVAVIKYAGCRFLCRGTRRGAQERETGCF